MIYPDIMVDIETTGLSPDLSAVIQIAAVRFNLKERSVDSSSMFNRCLAIPQRRFWDEGTRQWWSEQKRSVLMEIYAKMQDPKEVMQEFVDWVGYTPEVPHRFWAKPLSFDYPFIQSYLTQFNIPNPFHFRWATDQNSYIRGIANDVDVEQFKTGDFKGDAHNALFDVLNQIDTLFQASDFYANKSVTNEDQAAG